VPLTLAPFAEPVISAIQAAVPTHILRPVFAKVDRVAREPPGKKSRLVPTYNVDSLFRLQKDLIMPVESIGFACLRRAVDEVKDDIVNPGWSGQ